MAEIHNLQQKWQRGYTAVSKPSTDKTTFFFFGKINTMLLKSIFSEKRLFTNNDSKKAYLSLNLSPNIR